MLTEDCFFGMNGLLKIHQTFFLVLGNTSHDQGEFDMISC